jgi:tetratricopeptide (TPR) repeat protein
MRTRFVSSLCAVAAAVCLLGATGCDEISARRKVQEANDQYKNGRYEEAAKLYEEALAKSPDLTIAQHNLGVAYYKMMGSATDDAEIKAYADKAAGHLSDYLKHSASEKEQVLLRKLLTEIWINSGQVDKALAFWEAEHDARPDDLDVLDQLAGLNNKKQDWRKAIEWLHVWVASAKTDDGKAEAYQKIGNLCFLRMLSNRDTVVGAERIELSDTGTAALQEALKLQPKNAQIVSTLGSMNQQRALAEGSQIGFQIDLANHKDYMRQFSVLNKAKAAAPPAEAPAPSGDGS